jgi:hypothetical protein
MKPAAIDDIRRTWAAMRKFANDESPTAPEWEALSWLTLVDRGHHSDLTIAAGLQPMPNGPTI